MKHTYSLVITTCPNESEARKMAKGLVERKLVACAQLLPIQSIYRWKDLVSEAPEILLLLKTRTAIFDDLEKRIKQLHPYEIPEIIQLPITAGSLPYLHWIDQSTDVGN